MSILVNKESKVVIQGITGSEGQFHGKQMLEYGTNIVSGVTPGKGGIKTLDKIVPVYNSVEEAVNKTQANTSIIFYLLISLLFFSLSCRYQPLILLF